MEATLLDLSKRVERLEQEVHALRHERNEPQEMPPRTLTLAEQGRLMMERARRNAAYESKRLGEIFDQMGITRDPTMTRAKVQQMYLDAGFDPEATDFAQGIVAMRDE
jgi:hypothetical protein